MNTKKIEILKRKYLQPEIVCVKLDNEISLSMQSEPPTGPEETFLPRYLNNDPFKQLT